MHASFMPRLTRLSLRNHLTTVAATAVLAAFGAALTLPTGAGAASASEGLTLTPPVSISGLSSGEVGTLLGSTPLEDLSATELAKQISQLSGLGGILPGGSLKQALIKTIDELAANGDTLEQLGNSSPVVSELSTRLNELIPAGLLSLLLENKNLTSVLESSLGSLNPSELVEGLLASANEPEREQLIENILTSVAPELQSLLGTTLSGEPFGRTDVTELANQLGTTTEGLGEDVEAVSALPGTAMALIAPLGEGKDLAALDGLEGLHLAELLHETTSEALGGGGEGGGSGGTGGAGGSGSSGSGGSGAGSGTPSNTTVVLSTTNAGAPAPGAGATAASAKVAILSRKVKGHSVTLVVRVPAAGTLKVSGNGVKSVSKQVAKTEQVTVRLALSKAGAASLRKHHKGLTVRLSASFKPVSGASSAATTTVTVR